MWNVISLLVFILSQELLPSWNQGEERSQFVGYLIFFCRVWNYIVGMGPRPARACAGCRRSSSAPCARDARQT